VRGLVMGCPCRASGPRKSISAVHESRMFGCQVYLNPETHTGVTTIYGATIFIRVTKEQASKQAAVCVSVDLIEPWV
jgi:hypothetical protein